MNNITIKNYELERLISFLLEFDLPAKHSRMRTRFVRLLNEYLNRFKSEHQDLILKHSYLDEEGNPLVVEEKGMKKYDVKNVAEFNKDYNELLVEKCIIEITEERKEMIAFVKSMILDCEKTFKDEEALMYDRYCEIVESLEIE